MTLLVVLLEAVEILDEAEAVKMAVVEGGGNNNRPPCQICKRTNQDASRCYHRIVIPASKSYCCFASY
jgi:hypothetical protein